MKEEHRCGECGKNFGSEDTLEKHLEMDHSSSSDIGQEKVDRDLKPNREQVIGAMLGFLLAALFISGFNYVQEADFETEHDFPDIKGEIGSYYNDLAEPTVEITVVTCDNCSYSRFRDETDKLMKTEYREVDYRSKEGKKLIEKYDLSYAPGFIFEKEVEKAENFTRIESVLIEFEDAYVLPAEGVEAAQRMSEGMELEQEQHR